MILRSLFNVMLLSALVSGAFPTGVAAQDPAKTKGEPLTIETKATTPTPIPDFVAAYGLSFSSTHSLGQRLMDARKMSDPVALAMIGTEMAVDEEVSGKKAGLTSAAIMSEARDLAKIRAKEKELAAVAMLLKDKAAAQELTEMMGPARDAEAKLAAKIKSGERALGIRVLHVVNQTEHHLSVRVNGEHVGWIEPFNEREYFLPQHHHHQHFLHLSAHDHQGQQWHAQEFTGDMERFTWVLIL
jgi:hypothetical protein